LSQKELSWFYIKHRNGMPHTKFGRRLESSTTQLWKP